MRIDPLAFLLAGIPKGMKLQQLEDFGKKKKNYKKVKCSES